jgi:hypothetical protein
MNVGIGTVVAQFLFWEYLFLIFGYCFFAVHTQVHLPCLQARPSLHILPTLHPASMGKHNYLPPPPPIATLLSLCTEKEENKIFLIHKDIQKGSVAKPYMTNGLLIYD